MTQELIERLRKMQREAWATDAEIASADALETLTAERDALAKDAVRYRWLREATTEELGAYATVMPGQSDNYIDAAIAKEQAWPKEEQPDGTVIEVDPTEIGERCD